MKRYAPAAVSLLLLWQNVAPAAEPPCGYTGWKPVTGDVARPIPNLAKPARGKAFADPSFLTCITRVTDHLADGLKGFARHEYSRRQAFNADDSRILVTSVDGGWYLYDARTFKLIRNLDTMAGDAEPQWHPTNPDLLYYVPRDGVGLKLYELNVAKNRARVVGDFESRIRKLWPRAFSAWTHDYGSASADGRYFTFEVADSDWKGLGVFTYDVQSDKILGTLTLPVGAPQPLPTMAPSGKYVVVSRGKEGGPTTRYTLDFKNPLEIAKKVEHSDIALDAAGDDVFVSVDYDTDGGPVYMVNLRTGARTNLFPTYLDHTATAMHFSGKAFKKPGWFLLSTYADDAGDKPKWLYRQVMAVELKAKPRIFHLAHHRSVPDGYWTEPHATVNRDFTKILFNSNWNVKTDLDVDTYLLQLPSTWLP